MRHTPSQPNLTLLEQLMQQLQLKDGTASSAAAAVEELAVLSRKACYRSMLMEDPNNTVSSIADLLQHSSNPAVARHAAAVAQNLAIEPEHCKAIAAHCMQPLLQLLLATDDKDKSLLAAVAGALSNLAYDTSTCETVAAAAGCVQRLVQLLSHRSCVVREAAASVLGKLAWEPQLCEPIAAAGAVRPLVSLLSPDLSDDGGRQVAAAALENLTYDNEGIRRSVVQAGAVPLLVSLLESETEPAQKSAAGALNNLALARANCASIAAAGGIEPLVELLETGPEALQSVAGGALGKLAQDASYRVEIVEARERLLESDGSGSHSN